MLGQLMRISMHARLSRGDVTIRKWHPGKLIILWAWGGVAAALALTFFLSSPVKDTPAHHLVELLFVLLALFVLSGITWHWLGGRESGGK